MTTTQQPMARVIDAIAFAAYAHRRQRRKDEERTPYINHPIALVRILSVEAGIDDPDVLCAAHNPAVKCRLLRRTKIPARLGCKPRTRRTKDA